MIRVAYAESASTLVRNCFDTHCDEILFLSETYYSLLRARVERKLLREGVTYELFSRQTFNHYRWA